jgi:eukaryotic-like serine/threonine-protein kinase
VNGRLIAGRYELRLVIGQGGMGQVWTAHDHRLDRTVAVKLLRPDRVAGTGDHDELRRRFARESRVTARVDHPGLITVHDTGADGDDLYLVMSYVQGADLADHLAEHSPYPWPWAVAVAAQICPVLAAVHAVPVVHRDLKPRNVMIRPDGTVVVLDLGIAAVLDAEATRLTETGIPLGSPAYMAPEQAVDGEVGPRTDLYSLGVILHELLGGATPFSGPSALAVLHRLTHDEPVPLRRIRPEVPEPLEELVLRLLRKDPRDRPADAGEVHDALAPLLPAPSPADLLGPMDPTRPFRRPFAPWPGRRRPPAVVPPAATAAPDAAGGSGHAAVPTPRDSVGAGVEEARRLLDAGRVTQAVGVLGDALAIASRVHGEHSRVVGVLRKQYAATLMENGQFASALRELRLLAEARTAEAGAGDAQALRFRYEAAQCLEQLGETARALTEYRLLVPHLEQHADPAFRLEVRHRMGRLLLSSGDGAGARSVLARVLLDAERAHGPHHPVVHDARRALEWLDRVHT